jgi:hypothetical protein
MDFRACQYPKIQRTLFNRQVWCMDLEIYGQLIKGVCFPIGISLTSKVECPFLVV